MYNSRRSVGSRARQTCGFKSSLGNDTPRYNSEVAIERKKYFQSSRYLRDNFSKNSQDVPEWMSRTNTFHLRNEQRRGSMFTNPEGPFRNIQQTYIYGNTPKHVNP